MADVQPPQTKMLSYRGLRLYTNRSDPSGLQSQGLSMVVESQPLTSRSSPERDLIAIAVVGQAEGLCSKILIA